jgi:hypothetical protein
MKCKNLGFSSETSYVIISPLDCKVRGQHFQLNELNSVEIECREMEEEQRARKVEGERHCAIGLA